MKSKTPGQFRDDSVATSTDWSPLKTGGSGVRTHQLTQTGTDRMEMTLTGFMRLIPPVLAGVGTLQGVVCLFFARVMADGAGPAELLEKGEYMILSFGLLSLLGIAVAIGLATYFYIRARCPIVFDRQVGWYWQGSKSPTEVSNPAHIKTAAPLDQIHALQILDEYVVSEDSEVAPFHSYELNLVLRDAKRVNVVDHSSLTTLRHDAAMLAEFLNVPVWDAAEESPKNANQSRMTKSRKKRR